MLTIRLRKTPSVYRLIRRKDLGLIESTVFRLSLEMFHTSDRGQTPSPTFVSPAEKGVLWSPHFGKKKQRRLYPLSGADVVSGSKPQTIAQQQSKCNTFSFLVIFFCHTGGYVIYEKHSNVIELYNFTQSFSFTIKGLSLPEWKEPKVNCSPTLTTSI